MDLFILIPIKIRKFLNRNKNPKKIINNFVLVSQNNKKQNKKLKKSNFKNLTIKDQKKKISI